MARKPKLDPFDFSNETVLNASPEASANRRRYLTENDPRNREAEGWAFIKALVDDGVNLSDEDQINILNDFIRTGDTTYTAPPSFDSVESSASDYKQEPSSLSSIVGGLAAGTLATAAPTLTPVLASPAVRSTLGELVTSAQDPRVREYAAVTAEAGNAAKVLAEHEAKSRGLALEENSTILGLINKGLTAPFRGQETLESLFLPGSAREQLAEVRRKDAAEKLAQATARTQQIEQELGGKYGVGTTLARAVGGIASQPEQVGSVVGGLAGGALTRTPSGAAVGAGVGSIPMAESVYNAAIMEGSQFGDDNNRLSNEELNEYAIMQVAAELGPDVAFSVFGAGLTGLLNKWGPTQLASGAIRNAVQNSLTAKGALAVGAGSLSEVVAEEAGLRAQEFMGENISNDVVSRDIAQASAEERARGLERFIDPAVAGGLQAGAIAGPAIGAGHIRQQQEAAAYSQALEDLLNSGAQNAQEAIVRANELRQAINARRRQEQEQEVSKEDTELNLDIAREEERIRNEEARTRAFEQAEAERDAQRELEEEAGFQTIEQGAGDTTRVERYAGTTGPTEAVPGSPAARGDGIVERVPVGAAREVTPEDVAAQRERAEEQRLADEQAEQERLARVEEGKRIEAIRKAQEAQRKKEADAAKKEQTKQTRADRARHNQIVAELTEQYPDYTPAQLEPLVRERMAQPAPPAPPPASKEKTPEQKQESVIRSVVGRMGKQRDDAQRKALTARVQRYVRANPNATADDVVAAFTGQPIAQPEAAPSDAASAAPAPVVPVREAPTTPDNKLSDQEVDDLAGRFLGMADGLEGLRAAGQARRQPQDSTDTADTETTPDVEEIPLIPEIDMEDFKARTKQFVRGLTSRGRGDSKSVQQMLWNGQLAFVPNAASIGRNTDNVAEYDVESGQMFLFADKLQNPGDAVSAIARAFHEATHAGQFNDREGRSNLFRHFLGDGKVQQAATTIRNAAAKGNAIAQRALAKAEADTRSRQGDNRFEDLEVVGYFTSEVVESRRGTLGTVGGVVRDITTGAREFLRDNLGLDLDITVDDLATAAANVGSEIVQTEVSGLSSNPNVLGMIYNVNPDSMTEGQRAAIDNGWVYDSADGTRKFVLSDHEATIKPGMVETLRTARGATRLADVIEHPVLFNEREAAADLPVYVVSEVLGTARGMYDPGDPAIYVREDVLNNPEELKGVLLHETQHYVQDMDGRSGQFYDGRDLVNRQATLLDELADRTSTLDTAARTLLDTLPNTLPARERGRLLRELMRNTTEKDSVNAAVARDFVQGLENIPQEAVDAIAQYEQVRQSYNSYLPQYRSAVAQAHNDYLANITEGEAHFVQDNAEFDTTGVNPEPEMRERVGRVIEVPTKEQIVLGMAAVDADAADYSPTNSPAFREWFGKSQVKDARGIPQVYYHGTKHYFNAFRPNDLGLIFASPDRMFAEAFAGMDWEGNQRGAIPLYVRAENVWHYDNPDHIAAILNDPAVAEYVDLYYGDLADSRQKMSEGDWSLIETPEVIGAIKAAGFDALTVYEGGAKNIAVFTPNQLKHATDNKGAWSRQDDNFLGMADDGIDALWGTNIPEPDLPSNTREVLPANRFVAPDSPEFKKWFGNSKITNEDGSAKAMFHATRAPENFDVFTVGPSEIGIHVGTPEQASDPAFVGPLYTQSPQDPNQTERARIYPVYIRIENPLRTYDAFGLGPLDVYHAINEAINGNNESLQAAKLREKIESIISYAQEAETEELYYSRLASSYELLRNYLKGKGYDGIVYKNRAEGVSKPGEYGNQVPSRRDFHPYATDTAQDSYIVFSSNQIKSASANNGAYSLDNPSILGMSIADSAPASTGNAARSRVTKTWITDIFRNDKGLGEQVLNWVELSKSSPAYDSMAAEAKLRDYQIGLEELARERGTDVRTISNEIANKLDELAKDTDKYSENKAAWAGVLADYGKAGEALMDMRNRADALTINILQLRDQQGGDLTPAEQRAYKAMAANLGRYVHRMYAAGSGKAGRKYSQAVWNAHMKSRDAKANMTTAEKHNAAVVQRALKVLADDLTIPDEMTLLQMDREAVGNLYDTWVGTSSEGLDIVEMADRLIEVRDTISPERINNQAEQTARELLGLLKGDVTTPLGKFYRGNKLDRGILQERKQIDPAIRELMGEIRDPGVALLGTVGKQAEFVARQKLMLQLRSVVGRDLQPPSATGTSVVLDNNMQRLEGPDFGALEGWYASPNMKLALDSTAQHLVTLEQALANMGAQPGQVNDVVWTKLREGWMTAAGFTKATSILGNPILFGINWVGSFDTMLMNGNYTSPTTQTRALKEALELITYAVNPSASSEATRLLAKYGVIDSAQIGELKNMNYKQIQDHIRSLVKQDGKRRKLLNFGRGVTMGWKEAYAMMDVWAKIANFHQNVNDITAYNEAEGKGWTQEQIYERASAATKRLNISYQRAAPFVKALERGGITMFGTYFYETFRVQAENIAEVGRDLQAAKDATTPEGRNVMLGRATKRALGIVASNSLKYVAAKKFAELVFGDDEDKWYNMRGLLPEFLQNQDFIPVGKDKDGHIVVFPISRLDPVGPNTDIIREIIHGNGDPKKVAQQLLDLYIAPRIAGSVIAQVAGRGREPTFQQVAPGVYGEVVNATGGRAKVVKAVTNIAETTLPGIANAYRSSNAPPIPTDAASQAWAYSTYLGNRLYKIDPNESARFAGFEYSNFDKAAKDEVKEYFKSQTNPTVEDVQRVVTRITGDEKKEWDKLRRLYLGMEGFGMSSSDISAVMKDSPIPKAVQSTVANGTFVPNTITIRSLETYKNNIKKGKSDREKEEVEKKWDAMIDTLTQVLKDE